MKKLKKRVRNGQFMVSLARYSSAVCSNAASARCKTECESLGDHSGYAMALNRENYGARIQDDLA